MSLSNDLERFKALCSEIETELDNLEKLSQVIFGLDAETKASSDVPLSPPSRPEGAFSDELYNTVARLHRIRSNLVVISRHINSGYQGKPADAGAPLLGGILSPKAGY